MSKLRIGFVGVGGMGQTAHLAHYAFDPDCEVVALAELRTALGEKVAARYSVPKVYPDHKAMLASEKLDGIVAIQRFETHGQLIPQLLEYGAPVITEKPIASSVEAGEKIVGASKRAGTPLSIAYHKRSDPATIYAKSRIEEWKKDGSHGKLKYIRIEMPPGDWIAEGFRSLLGSDEPYPTLALDPPPAGMDQETARRYNAFVNYYIHQVNLLRHLLGEDYRVSYADPCEVVLCAISDSGVSCTIEMAAHQTTVDWQEAALVCFERGWIRLELPPPMAANRAGTVKVYSDAGSPFCCSPALPHVDAMRQQSIHFLRALKGEQTPLCGPEDAVKDLRVARDYIELLTRTQV